MATDLYIGLISGTSMDGIDAALVDFSGDTTRVICTGSTAYGDELTARLRRIAIAPDTARMAAAGGLHIEVANAFAGAASELIRRAGVAAQDIVALGSHGQTVLHRPDGEHPFSLQLGDAGTIATQTGIPVVADFRNADLALGGQGAPLVPAFHRWAFGHSRDTRAVINIGGIANVTLLDPGGATTGFDTGPGNTLLDAWCREQRGDSFDAGGAWAAGGRVHADLLAVLLADPYLSRPPPKSTGTDYFNDAWLADQRRRVDATIDPRDVQATLAEFTARTIAEAIDAADAVAVCGGGAHNDDLMDRLARLLQPRRVDATSAWGIDPDWVEAVAFAWMARQRIRGEPSNVPAVTGASAEVSLGGIYLPPTQG